MDRLYVVVLSSLLSVVCLAAECDKTHPDVTVSSGEEVTLTCETTDADTYLWSPGGQTTSSITVNPTEETTYKCKATKNGSTEDTDNLIGAGDFEFAPSSPVTSAKNKYGLNVSYSYLNFDQSGKNINIGAVTTATNANNVKTAYFSNLAPQHGSYLLVCDGGNSSSAQVWRAQNFCDGSYPLKSGVEYKFSCYAANIDKEYKKHGKESLAKLKFMIEYDGSSGGKELLAFTVPETLGQWQKYEATFTPSNDLNWCNIWIVNYTTVDEGNDFAIDNIYFGSVTSTQDVTTNECFPVKISSGKKDTVRACYSEETTLSPITEGDGYTYEWKNSEGATVGTSKTYMFKAESPKYTWYCSVKNADKVISNDTILVVTDANPGYAQDVYTVDCAGEGPVDLIVRKLSKVITPEDYETKGYSWNPEFSYSMNGEYMGTLPDTIIHNAYYPKKLGETNTYVHTIVNGACKRDSKFLLIAKACPPDPINHNDTLCQSIGGVATLTPETTGTAYKWSDGSTERTLDISLSEADTLNYSCTITTSDIEGSDQVENFTVIINPFKTTELSGSVCEGKEFSQDGFTFTASETATVGKLDKSRTETTSQGCDSIITFTLTVYPNPVFSVTSEKRKAIIAVESGAKPYTFQIDGGRVVTEEVITGMGEGWHKIVMTDANTCQSIDSVLIDLKPIKPMVYFTPNGDGLNDLWLVENIEYYPEAIIQIFDRYHKLLHTYKASEFEGWDGMYNGHQVQFTDYWYYIQGDDLDKAYSGHFILKR